MFTESLINRNNDQVSINLLALQDAKRQWKSIFNLIFTSMHKNPFIIGKIKTFYQHSNIQNV